MFSKKISTKEVSGIEIHLHKTENLIVNNNIYVHFIQQETKRKVKSSTKRKLANPQQFDETLFLHLTNTEFPLTVEVWQKSLLSAKKKFLGTATIDLSNLVNGVAKEFNISLQRVNSGTVYFSLKAYKIGKNVEENDTSNTSQDTNTGLSDSIYASRNSTDAKPKPTPPYSFKDSEKKDDGESEEQSRYKLLKQIGRGFVVFQNFNLTFLGGMGTVFLAEDTNTKAKVAIKKIRCDNYKELNNAMKEVWPIRSLHHEHLVFVNDLYMEEGNFLCLVMDYFEEGDLSQFLKKRKFRGVPLSEEVARSYFLQLASALQYLHQSKFLHRDIKPANIFMCKDYSTLKIGDFGMVRKLDPQEFAKTTAGTQKCKRLY